MNRAAPSLFRGLSVPTETDLHVRAAYAEGAGVYRILPSAVALPRNCEDVKELVRWARATKTPLVPRGAGSGMGGGNVGDGVVVDLTAGLSGTPKISNRRAVAEAGVRFQALADMAARHGLRLPPEPSSGRFCTLGGMVACNAAGPRSLRYGAVREWVEGVEVVWSDGTSGWVRRGERDRWGIEREVRELAERHADLVVQRFPATTKNASGYALDRYLDTGDLVDLIVGSEGTLALVTAIEFRLDPIPTHRASVLVALREPGALGSAVAALTAHRPSALELLDRTFLDVVRDAPVPIPAETAAVLIAEFEGTRPETVRGVVGDAVRAVRRLDAVVETGVTPADEAALWALRHAASPVLARLPETRRSLQVIEDACVPVAALGAYVAGVCEAARRHGIEVVLFGHAGDGHVHVNALVDLTRPDWEEGLRGLFAKATALVARLGGTLSGEHGDGRLRAASLTATFGAELVDVFRAVKRLFDPESIFNPGIIVPDGSDPLARLKIGAGAVPLPEAVAAALRAVEREGNWERNKVDLARGTPAPN